MAKLLVGKLLLAWEVLVVDKRVFSKWGSGNGARPSPLPDRNARGQSGERRRNILDLCSFSTKHLDSPAANRHTYTLLDMFSTQAKGLDGLEKFEVEDLLSAVADIQKAKKDAENKKKRKQPQKKENQKHDDAVEQLTQHFDNWNRRPHHESQAALPVLTAEGVTVPKDAQARHALRRLHEHLRLRQNPVAMNKETWLAKLVELSDAFFTFLPKSPVPIPDAKEMWKPTVLDPLPFQGKITALFLPPTSRNVSWLTLKRSQLLALEPPSV